MVSVTMLRSLALACLVALTLSQEVERRADEADLAARGAEGEGAFLPGNNDQDEGPPPLDGEGPLNATEQGPDGPYPHPPPPTGPPQYKACHVDATAEELFYPNRKTIACFMVLDAFEILHNQLPEITPESDPVEDKIAADKNSCETVVNILNTILGEDETKLSECCDLRCWCTDLKEDSYKDEDSLVCQGRIFVPEYVPEEGQVGPDGVAEEGFEGQVSAENDGGVNEGDALDGQ